MTNERDPLDAVPPARSAEDLTDPEGERQTPVRGTDRRVRAGDAAELRKKQVDDKERQLQEERDLVEVASTPAGRRFLARLIVACGWNQPHFHPSNSIMCEVAGRRSIAFQLEQWLSDADLDLFLGVRRELEALRPKAPKVETVADRAEARAKERARGRPGSI